MAKEKEHEHYNPPGHAFEELREDKNNIFGKGALGEHGIGHVGSRKRGKR